ncbi:M14 family zinc carboxypeptidase [Sulfidibacter corallicola]|uniref:Peptidase M14 domain-containing protein n=1 Tax=Sulfidibacter corallicola TaxID=2818388 RepID=A0A8A4TDK8_SULCO|nr:M14 family zinc carboxypeptidase [Sulfidibacter corallicola]QTD48179.1 hypothetical protein J3U87_21545 [Sulfidibacter corallicola]
MSEGLDPVSGHRWFAARWPRVLFSLLLVFWASLASLTAGDRIVVRVWYGDRSVLQEIAAWTHPWEVDPTAGVALIEVSPEELAKLEDAGLRWERDEVRTEELNRRLRPLPGQESGIPQFPCYPTVAETNALIDRLVADHPELVQVFKIGESWIKQSQSGPGHDLRVLRITNRAFPTTEPKPMVFVMSAQHAREYTPAGLNTRFAEMLLTEYGRDADITWLLDYQEIHLLLQANPDGRVQAETGLSWRKNADNLYCTDVVSRGVDLNRNYDFHWGCCNGSDDVECSITFRGVAAASEPEVTAVQDYLAALFEDARGPDLDDPAGADTPGLFIDLHSYGEDVLWPWAHTEDGSPNADALRALGRKLAWFNGYDAGQGSGLYIFDGSTIDYAYGERGVASYLVELGTQFFQDCFTFEHRILPDNLVMLRHACKAARRPYQLGFGPDVVEIAALGAPVPRGHQVPLTAQVDAARLGPGLGPDPAAIAAVNAYLDVPPWLPEVVALPMSAIDGAFDGVREAVRVTIDSGSLAVGRHTVFVQAVDAAGGLGVVSAHFLDVIEANGDDLLVGQIREAAYEAPLGATVRVGDIEGASNPVTGDYLLTGSLSNGDLRVEAPGYRDRTLPLGTIGSEEARRDLQLLPLCPVLENDAETTQPDWLAQGGWERTSEIVHGGRISWSDSPNGPYGPNLTARLTTPAIDIAGFSEVGIRFFRRCDLAEGDRLIAEVSGDGGEWVELVSFEGNSAGWIDAQFAVPEAMAGSAALTYRFTLVTDDAEEADGCYVDDITLWGVTDRCGTGFHIGEQLAHWANGTFDVLRFVRFYDLF